MEELKAMVQGLALRHAELQAQLGAQAQASAQREQLLLKGLVQTEKVQQEVHNELHVFSDELLELTRKIDSGSVDMRERVDREGVKGRGAQSRLSYRPTAEFAERQPSHVCELGHQSLAELSMLGNHTAKRERLLREIMAVDGSTWEKAHEVLLELDYCNERFYWLESLPYRIGITLAAMAGIGGCLLVFYKPVAKFYADKVAKEPLPEGVEDISEMTTNQVGSWTWKWMEPMIGTACFVLLCCQFTRAQVKKMNMKMYGEHVLEWRAQRLSAHFPQYDRSMVQAWARQMPRVNWNFFPIYERDEGTRGPVSGL